MEEDANKARMIVQHHSYTTNTLHPYIYKYNNYSNKLGAQYAQNIVIS